MPDWAKAKDTATPDPAMKAAFKALRDKLFGREYESNGDAA